MRKSVRITALVLALALISSVAFAAIPKVKKATYKEGGYVKVEFGKKVKYKNETVTVKDSVGTDYQATITKKSDTAMVFKIEDVKPGTTYKFVIANVYTSKNSDGRFKGTITTPKAKTSLIESIEYKGNGKVEVEFKNNVQYKNPTLVVKDANGKKYTAVIKKKSKDEFNFKVKKFAPDLDYAFKITGIRAKGESKYTKVSGTFNIPAAGDNSNLKISKVDFDAEDSEIEVEFNTKVEYNKPTVSVKDKLGNELKTAITDHDDDSITVKVTDIKANNEYKVTVTGVRVFGATDFIFVFTDFTAVED